MYRPRISGFALKICLALTSLDPISRQYLSTAAFTVLILFYFTEFMILIAYFVQFTLYPPATLDVSNVDWEILLFMLLKVLGLILHLKRDPPSVPRIKLPLSMGLTVIEVPPRIVIYPYFFEIRL